MEKIKVNVSSDVYQILKKDMELFKFFKADESINSNQFINTLIANYYNLIEDEDIEARVNIENILRNNSALANEDITILASKISEYILEQQFKDDLYNTSISFKPTKVSMDAINSIEYKLNNTGLSKYFRILFSNYAKKPQYIRERIIFKDKVDIIDYALRTNTMISLKAGDKRKSYYPYKLIQSGEEMFNYLICYDDSNHLISFRLTNITDLVKTKEIYTISEDMEKKLKAMIELGPQFACDTDTVMEYAVKLTLNGQKKFKKIYIHRPKLDRIENDIYYFKCSYEQMLQYFFRFGKDAYVISPGALGKRLRMEFKEAYLHYTDEYNLSIKEKNSSKN